MFATAKKAYPQSVVYTGAGAQTTSYLLSDFRWLYAAFNVDTTWREIPGGKLEYCAVTQDMYDCLAYVVKMNQLGYLDPAYAVTKTEAMQKSLASFGSVFYGISWYDWPGNDAVIADKDNQPYWDIYGQAVGKNGMTGQYIGTPINGYVMIPRTCRIAQDVVNYVATLCSTDVYNFLFFGREGVDYRFEKDGSRVKIKDNYRSQIGTQFYVYYYIYENFKQRTDRLVYISTTAPFRVDRHLIYGLQMKSKTNPADNMPSIPIYIEKITDINDLCAKYFLKIATGALDLDAGWKTFQAEFQKLGGPAVVDAVNAWYTKSTKK